MRLTPSHFHILLAAAQGPVHGYAIKREVEQRTRGRVNLGPGSLYWAINKRVEAGLLEEATAPTARSEGPSRRYYTLSRAGRSRLADEIDILDDIVRLAQSKNLAGSGLAGRGLAGRGLAGQPEEA